MMADRRSSAVGQCFLAVFLEMDLPGPPKEKSLAIGEDSKGFMSFGCLNWSVIRSPVRSAFELDIVAIARLPHFGQCLYAVWRSVSSVFRSPVVCRLLYDPLSWRIASVSLPAPGQWPIVGESTLAALPHYFTDELVDG